METPYIGVRTTGIYCRPGCKSRAPLTKNIVHFAGIEDAKRAGYRACKRCNPDGDANAPDERFVQICRAIEQSEDSIPLAKLAEMANMSRFHLQRSFKAAIGVTPKQYGQMVKREKLRRALKETVSVTGALLDTSTANAGDALGMTPSQFRSGGAKALIVYTIVNSPLGRVLVAATARGICRVDIAAVDTDLVARLTAEFPAARLQRESEQLVSATSLIVAYLSGRGPWPLLPIDVRATAFQSRVWEALRAIAPGSTMTYGELAQAIGSPTAARAVARACASNTIALLVPCHRIVPQNGGVGGYRWDPERKERLLELERRTATR